MTIKNKQYLLDEQLKSVSIIYCFGSLATLGVPLKYLLGRKQNGWRPGIYTQVKDLYELQQTDLSLDKTSITF